MDIYQVLIRPLVTEKTTHQTTQTTKTHGGSYSFEVPDRVTKPQIRDAVEKIYKVKVVHVRTVNRPGKARSFRFRGGQTPRTKKAVVTLDKDSRIELF